jgi:hypothetical protein
LFCYLAKIQPLPKEPWLPQLPKLPAADDEDEGPADAKSVAAPVELADCANASFWRDMATTLNARTATTNVVPKTFVGFSISDLYQKLGYIVCGTTI